MKRGLRPHTMTFRVRLPVGEPVKPHNLLITVQPQFTFCASLSSVFSVRAGAGGTEDFGTAGQPRA
jgi:hypothetical protein